MLKMSVCQGKTNRGVKCNRLVNGERYCWQHRECVKTNNTNFIKRPIEANFFDFSGFKIGKDVPFKTILPTVDKTYCLVKDAKIISFETPRIIMDGLIIVLAAYSVSNKSIFRPFLFKEPLSYAEQIINPIVKDIGLIIEKFYDGNIVRIAFNIKNPTKKELESIVNTFGINYLTKDISLDENRDLYLELIEIEFYENGSLSKLLNNKC